MYRQPVHSQARGGLEEITPSAYKEQRGPKKTVNTVPRNPLISRDSAAPILNYLMFLAQRHLHIFNFFFYVVMDCAGLSEEDGPLVAHFPDFSLLWMIRSSQVTTFQ